MMSSDRISSNHLKPPIFACRVHRWIINSVPTPFLFFSATTTHDPSIYLHRLSILSVRCFSMTDPAIFILISSDDFVDRVFFFFCEKITTSSESTAEPHVAHLYGKYDFPVFPHIYIRLAHARFPTNTPYVETLRSIPTKTPPLPVRTFLPTRCTTITLLEHFFSFLPFFMSYFLPAHSRTSNRWPQAETCVTLIFLTFLFVRSFGYTTDDSRAYPASLTATIINRYYNDHIFIELYNKNGKMQGHPFLWLFPWNLERNNQMEQN